MTLGIFESKLKYEFVQKGKDVITFGDFGDKFYISLYGNVGVLIPMSKGKNDPKENKAKENKTFSKSKPLKREETKSFSKQIRIKSEEDKKEDTPSKSIKSQRDAEEK